MRAFLNDLVKLAAFIGAMLLVKFWYLSVPLLLAGAYLFNKHFKKG